MVDLRTNEEIARKLWSDLLDVLTDRKDIRRAFDDLSENAAAEVYGDATAIIMAALADVRGVGTC